MIIVSQDRDFIVNFDNIISIFIADAWEDKPGSLIKTTDISGHETILGYYKIEKRAKEVLNDIFVRKAMFDFYKTVMTDKVQNEICKDMKKDNILFNVLEMPEA